MRRRAVVAGLFFFLGVISLVIFLVLANYLPEIPTHKGPETNHCGDDPCDSGTKPDFIEQSVFFLSPPFLFAISGFILSRKEHSPGRWVRFLLLLFSLQWACWFVMLETLFRIPGR
jgi:hypothetical protein